MNNNHITIGILALHGAIQEHQAMLLKLQVASKLVKQEQDLQGCDALIIPGGESTTMCILANHSSNLFAAIQQFNKPIWGTCSGLILLADQIENTHFGKIGGIPIQVSRNFFGRQMQSFEQQVHVEGVGTIKGVFIRAPAITSVTAPVQILAKLENVIVAAQYKHYLVTAFHPELTNDTKMHEYFLKMVHDSKK